MEVDFNVQNFRVINMIVTNLRILRQMNRTLILKELFEEDCESVSMISNRI